MPSPDTFRRVFSWLDASAFRERLAQWVAGMFTVKRGQVVAWAGQTLPGVRTNARADAPCIW
jgi:hypothetical protein